MAPRRDAQLDHRDRLADPSLAGADVVQSEQAIDRLNRGRPGLCERCGARAGRAHAGDQILSTHSWLAENPTDERNPGGTIR